MNTSRMAARRLEEGRVEEEVPPNVEQVDQGYTMGKVSKVLKVLECLLEVNIPLMLGKVMKCRS